MRRKKVVAQKQPSERLECVNAYVQGESLLILRRDASGKLVTKTQRAEFVTYHSLENFPESLRRSVEKSKNVISTTVEGKWLRVSWLNDFARKWATTNDPLKNKKTGEERDSPFRAHHVETYEGDIHPVLRWMTDENVRIQMPRGVFLDIETDSRVPFLRMGDMRVLCWTLVSPDGHVVSSMLQEDTHIAERELLDELWSALEPYDQVMAWNGDRFDFYVIFERSKRRGCEVDVRRWLWLDHLEVFRTMNAHAAESGDEKTSLRLQDVCMAVLGEGKDNFNGAKTWEAWEVSQATSNPCPGCNQVHPDISPRECLLRYNKQDTILLQKLEKETGYIGLLGSVCDVCGVFPDTRGGDATRQVDAFMLRLGRERDIRFPTKRYGDQDESQKGFKGAYITNPTSSGIVKDVHVVDFARLYPSCIITYNMSGEMQREVPMHVPIPFGHCRVPFTNIVFATDKVGILPTVVKELIKLRNFWNDRKASLPPGTAEWQQAARMSDAYKIAVNSCYGVVASIYSRHHNREVAESVTQAGANLAQITAQQIRQRNKLWDVIYINTDSSFVVGPSNEEMSEFVVHLNKNVYPQLTASHGCNPEHHDIKLAYEKKFARIVLVGKNRYAGCYSHYKNQPAKPWSRPEIKGLEFKRGDAVAIARKMQERAIRLILGDWDLPPTCACSHPFTDPTRDKPQLRCTSCGADREMPEPYTENIEDYRALVSGYRDYILYGDLETTEFIISKSLTKSLASYEVRKKQDGTDMAEPAHVTIARILSDRGAEVGEGTKISFVVVDASNGIKAIPAIDFVHGQTKVDRHYLWESLVWPPTERLLTAAFPEQPWDQWFGRTRPSKKEQRALAAGQVVLFGTAQRHAVKPDHSRPVERYSGTVQKVAPSTGAPQVPSMRRKVVPKAN